MSVHNHTHKHMHTPGLAEPLAKPRTILVPPPPEPDLNSPLWPTGLLTQRPHISLRHKGSSPVVTLFPTPGRTLSEAIRQHELLLSDEQRVIQKGYLFTVWYV